MKNKNLLKSVSILMIAALGLVFSCNEEDRLTAQDTQDISEEAETDSYYQDLDDMGGVALQSDAATSTGRLAADGRISAGPRTIQITTDDRFKCSGVVITIEVDAASTATTPKGKITVDFGTAGCADNRGNVRKGKVIFTYNGRRFQPNSTVIITPENYFINDVKIEGTRTTTNIQGSTEDAPHFNVKLQNGKATFTDGTIATRESDISYLWVRATNPVNDKLVIESSSTASGTTRGGRTYAVSILNQLEFTRFCGIAVSGIKKYVIDGSKEITIDYGNGSCDRSITVTVNGITRNISVR